MDYLKIPVPELIYTSNEQSRVAIIETDLDIYMQVFEEKIVSGKLELTDDEWNKHLANLKKLKIDELIKIKNDAYERYLKR